MMQAKIWPLHIAKNGRRGENASVEEQRRREKEKI